MIPRHSGINVKKNNSSYNQEVGNSVNRIRLGDDNNRNNNSSNSCNDNHDQMEGRVKSDSETLASTVNSFTSSGGRQELESIIFRYQQHDAVDDFDENYQSDGGETPPLWLSTVSLSSSSSSSDASALRNIKTSFLSNTLFLCGSICSIWQALWDLWNDDAMILENTLEDGAYDDKYYSDLNGDQLYDHFWNGYNTLGVISALFLIGNSVVDVAWSIRDAQYERGRNSYQRQERRLPRSALKIAAAVTFGIAGSCSLASVGYNNSDNLHISYDLSTIACHVYFVNAVLSVIAEIPSFEYLSSALTASGDILFLMASIIDLILAYFSYPTSKAGNSSHGANLANLASSILWIVDAMLYIAADLIEMEDVRLFRRRRRRPRNNEYIPPQITDFSIETSTIP